MNEKFDEKHLSRSYFNELLTRKKNEDFITFSEEIERLVRLAYLDSPEEVRDHVACRQFINGIEHKELERVLRLDRIETLQTTVERATEFQSIDELLESKEKFSKSTNDFSTQNKRSFSSYKSQKRPNDKSHVQCHKCKTFGHYANECPTQNYHKDNAHKNSDSNSSRTFNQTRNPDFNRFSRSQRNFNTSNSANSNNKNTEN